MGENDDIETKDEALEEVDDKVEVRKNRRAVRRRRDLSKKAVKAEPREPFDLKSYLIPKDRNWVLPAYFAMMVILLIYYFVGFAGVVSEVCETQASSGDADCDGLPDPGADVGDESSETGSVVEDDTSGSGDNASDGSGTTG